MQPICEIKLMYTKKAEHLVSMLKLRVHVLSLFAEANSVQSHSGSVMRKNL